ncbi:MAG: hypothetical protein IPN51_03525 [Chloracidobacterium sp.]|nr:hypothetical protein [Chloracidobacterium sp.]
MIDLSSQLTAICTLLAVPIYKAFAEDIEKMARYSIPESVPDADTFMPRDFLGRFIQPTRRNWTVD